MYELKEYAETRVSSTLVDFNATNDVTLYTVPTGKSFVPTMLVVRGLSASMASCTFTAGDSANKTDFLNTITCSGANATTKMLILRPSTYTTTNTTQTPAVGSGLHTVMAAGATFVIDLVAAAGSACTGTVDLFGYLY